LIAIINSTYQWGEKPWLAFTTAFSRRCWRAVLVRNLRHLTHRRQWGARPVLRARRRLQQPKHRPRRWVSRHEWYSESCRRQDPKYLRAWSLGILTRQPFSPTCRQRIPAMLLNWMARAFGVVSVRRYSTAATRIIRSLA